MKILKAIGVIFALMVVFYISAVIWSRMNYTHSIFVKEDQLGEISTNFGTRKIESQYDWGKMVIEPPIEVSPHNYPQINAPVKFTMSIVFYDLLDPSIKSIKLKRNEFANIQPSLPIEQINTKHSYRDKPVMSAAGSQTEKMIEKVPFYFFVLDIPKNVKSFDMNLEIEINKESGSEIINFQETFYRSTYLFRRPD